MRLEIIKEIKDSKDKYILISTQLIEAGVDLDFDIVYRDIAPMDCINQSAGRANRNGAKGTGIVKLYKLMNNNNKIFAFFVYSNSLLEATLTILKDKRVIEENELWEINNEYFAKVKEVTDNHSLEEYKTYCEYIKNLRLQDIRKFELIEENKNKIDVIIRYNDEVEKYINIIENSKDYSEQDVINGWRGLNKYKISVNRDVVKDMVYEIKGSNFINGSDYNKNRGIIRRSSVII